MSDNIIVTEYVEETKVAQLLLQPQSVQDHEEFSQEPEALVVTFEEPMGHSHGAPAMPIGMDMPEIQVLEIGDEIGDVTEFEEGHEHDELLDGEDQEAMGFSLPSGHNGLPGATDYAEDEEEDEPEKEGDWENDRDPRAFMEYILEAYPGKIPKHDGTSISMGERVVKFLSRLNGEISEALRSDNDDHLDVGSLERMRVNMIKDIAIMKRHNKKLQRKHRESIAGLEQEEGLVKEATTPRIQLVMTPFERAITGILINATVSAGKPFEEVYDFLNKKYTFTEREELAIMQLAMDMGQPIFKDRGTIGDYRSQHDPSKHGVDFIKNYFA
jgi:hypothetical protein